ncbi:FliH/SctL family protein [Desulfuribacillus alkaliarsenatis]|uniref:Flagellar assembly protein FliH/Type III secretion system HrpE domain-containing protein n=1 Tax=Desulfuribacillus alkaliarsenatis TaxID=766136 RepID=A0A1E5G603_9FIRM|nr:FliH/SctL family protein [Desulfuribacillus alkaliarsenatis]OEF98606.1 hypothetical protein BHF68_02780 [Desulfuribacillus alkaliarsenatis]
MSSRIFKAGFVKPSTEAKVIEAKPVPFKKIENQNNNIEAQEAENDNKIQLSREAQEIINNAKLEAEEILQLAEQRATNINQTAEQEKDLMLKEIEDSASKIFETAKQDGFQAGYEEGYTAGNKQAHDDYMHRINEVNIILKEANKQKVDELLEAQELVTDIAFEVAKKILLKNPEVLKEQIVDLVTKSLEKVRDTEKVEINVNPKDFSVVNDALPNLKNIIHGKADIVIQVETHIDEGSCVLHTSLGTIDATVTTQLEEIKKALQSLDLGSEGIAEA